MLTCGHSDRFEKRGHTVLMASPRGPFRLIAKKIGPLITDDASYVAPSVQSTSLMDPFLFFYFYFLFIFFNSSRISSMQVCNFSRVVINFSSSRLILRSETRDIDRLGYLCNDRFEFLETLFQIGISFFCCTKQRSHFRHYCLC